MNTNPHTNAALSPVCDEVPSDIRPGDVGNTSRVSADDSLSEINRILRLQNRAPESRTDNRAEDKAPLRGKVALVSEAAHGIGRCVAVMLGQRGATVIVNHSRPSLEAETTCDTIRAFGGHARPVLCDVTCVDDCNKMVDEALEEYDQVDILINSLGRRCDVPFHRMNRRQWSSVVLTNLNGAFNLTRAVINPMRQREYGRIVFMTEPPIQMNGTGQANFSASRTALVGLTRALAEENAACGITVNCVRPGFIEARQLQELSMSERERIVSGIPAGRLGRPEEIANLVEFLVSDKAGYITGQEYRIDGGLPLL